MLLLRYIASPILSICAAFLLIEWAISFWLGSNIAALMGLLWIGAAAILGGIVCSIIAPANKIATATLTGPVFGALLHFAFFVGEFNGHPDDISGFLEYWPIWSLPSYSLGGVIGNTFRKKETRSIFRDKW